jgi:hypothetical protein
MSEEDRIARAVREGVITAEQAERMLALDAVARPVAAPPPLPPMPPPAPATRPIDPDDEKFRLIGGFNDVFVAIGLLLLIGGLYTLAGVLGLPDALSITSAVIAWGLSEVFCRRLRLALPSIMLAMMFTVSFTLVIVLNLFGTATLDRLRVTPGGVGATVMAIIGGAIVLSALLHYWRFRVPFAALLIGVGALVLFYAGVVALVSFDRAREFFLVVLFASGLGVFAVAMVFDVTDPERVTRRSDVGFWLHLLAAPLLVHPVLTWGAGGLGLSGNAWAAVTLLLFGAIGVVALLIDRRAMLVSGLISAGAAISLLIGQATSHPFAASLTGPLTLLALAGVVLALSAFWRSLRARLMRLLPAGRWRAALPPA